MISRNYYFLAELPQERFFKKHYSGPYPAESASGYALHSAKLKRKSAVCLHFYSYLPYLFYLLDHDEERFKRSVVVDKNGASFNVVFDVADKRFYWLMLPIQLSPIVGVKQNLNLSDPFPPNKDFFDPNSNNKLEDSGVDDIMRCVLFLMLFY